MSTRRANLESIVRLRSNARALRRTLPTPSASFGALRGHRLNGASFRRQVPIENFIADFVCHAAKLVIELDGGQHFSDQAEQADAARSAVIEAQGFKVLRFSNHDVMTNRAGVLETIAAAVAERAPTLTLPRKRERETREAIVMKFTLSWLKEHLDTDEPLEKLADKLTMIGLEVENIEDKAKALAPFSHRAGDLGRAASECGSPARLHGRYRRRRRTGAGGVRRAECARRPRQRVLAARHLHSRQEHHARRRHHPRRREPRHAVLGGGAADFRRS